MMELQNSHKRSAEDAAIDTDRADVPTQRRLDRRVHFSTETSQHVCTRDILQGLTDSERRQVSSQLWYSRKDFDDFLNDRVSTIRVWRSMGGNITKELNNYYCLRGLEPYQSPSLNTEMHSHRCMHHKAILREQRRQRRAGVTDPDRIQAQVSHMSAWALQRAQRLGAVDARDVLSSQDSSSCVSQQRRFSSAAHFQTSNVGNSGGGSNTVANSNMPRRTSMPTAVFSQQQHQSVNVDQLKAWNVNLLERMAKEQAVAACVKSTPTMVDELGLGGDVKSTTNFPTMSLRELLKAPHPLMHSKRAPDFLTFSSSGEEAMKRLPYQVIRRDSLSCHGA